MDEDRFQELIDTISEHWNNVCQEPGCSASTAEHKLMKPSFHKYCKEHRFLNRKLNVNMPTNTKAQRRRRQLAIYDHTLKKKNAELTLLRRRVDQLEQRLGIRNGNN